MKKLWISTLALFSVLAVSAQEADLTDIYSDAVAAYNVKDYATAVEGLATVIDRGMDMEDEEVQGWVATAKQILPNSYFMMGGAAFQQGDYDTALADFTRAAELAELYGDAQRMQKSKEWIANVYKVQGGEAYNAQDWPTAITIYSKAHAADPHNTEMALNLAASYAESAVAGMEVEQYLRSMEIYKQIAALDNPKFAEAVASATKQIDLYTTNMIAKMQGAGNDSALIALTDGMLAADQGDALAHRIRVQVLYAMKNYQGVIAAVPAAVAAQTADEARSDIYFTLGAAYNALSQAPQAIESFKKVTVGSNLAAAKQVVEQLSKTN